MTEFAGVKLKNRLTASSSPLTESVSRLRCCRDAGFGAAILKSAAPYVRRGNGYGRKVLSSGQGYYADGSFEGEIMTLEEGIALYQAARSLQEEMFLIPSVCVMSTEERDWVSACEAFQRAGARLLQLDFFYLGNMTAQPDFPEKLRRILSALRRFLHCAVMPKLNPRFQPEEICRIIAACGIKYVSLLDSMRENPPPEFGMHAGSVSYFGSRQLPLTRRFLSAAVEQGLHVCAGGGVTSPDDAIALLSGGAELVQTASYVLTHGFGSVSGLCAAMGEPAITEASLCHNPWCDTEEGAPCIHCGACHEVWRKQSGLTAEAVSP